MSDLGQLLAAIRFADSAFPSGGFAFSSGLEGAHRDGWVEEDDFLESDVAAFAAEQLVGRWHQCDRVLFRMAWAQPDPVAVDALAEAVGTMSVLREASRRAGAAALTTFAAIGDRGAPSAVADYRSRVLAGAAPGHLPVAQAICLRAVGLTRETAEAVTAWQVVAGITGAAVRLGICGHLGAQRITTALNPLLLDVLARVPPAEPCPFTAYADIAAQRRGDGARLFAS